MKWHIRYSVKTTNMLHQWAGHEPVQHAVDNETIKTLCGRDAGDYWKLDEDQDTVENVSCLRCRKKLGLES